MKITQDKDGRLIIDAEGADIPLSMEGVNPATISGVELKGWPDSEPAPH